MRKRVRCEKCRQLFSPKKPRRKDEAFYCSGCVGHFIDPLTEKLKDDMKRTEKKAIANFERWKRNP